MRNWATARARLIASSQCRRAPKAREVRSDKRPGLSLLALAVWLVVVASSIGLAQTKQYPIFTTDHLNSAMRTVGLAFGLTGHAIQKNDPELAKDYLVRARDQLATTITFWRDRKKDDAIAILRDDLKKMDALDTTLSAEKVDLSAAADLAKQVNASCEACHAKYREQDPITKAYRVRADSVPQ